MSGRAHALPWIAEHVGALVYAWVPGEQGGAAIADMIFGIEAPTGRLPISLPRSAGHVPVHHDHRAGGGRSQIFGDYVDVPSWPLYFFGSGLTYTTFEYESLRVREPVSTDTAIIVEVELRNSGKRAGTEVVQLFLRDEVARVARPDRQLVGFAARRCRSGPIGDGPVLGRPDPAGLLRRTDASRHRAGCGAGHGRRSRTRRRRRRRGAQHRAQRPPPDPGDDHLTPTADQF